MRARQHAPRSSPPFEPQRSRRACVLSAQRVTAPASVDLAHAGPSSATAVRADTTLNSATTAAAQPRTTAATLLSQHRQAAALLDQPMARHGGDDAHVSTGASPSTLELDNISAVDCTPQLAGTHEATSFEARGDSHPASASADEQPAESGFLTADGLAAIQTSAEPPPPAAAAGPRWLRRHGGREAGGGSLEDQPPESGVLPEDRLTAVRSELQAAPLAAGHAAAQSPGIGATLFHPQEQSQIRDSWRKIMRWSREFKVKPSRRGKAEATALPAINPARDLGLGLDQSSCEIAAFLPRRISPMPCVCTPARHVISTYQSRLNR